MITKKSNFFLIISIIIILIIISFITQFTKIFEFFANKYLIQRNWKIEIESATITHTLDINLENVIIDNLNFSQKILVDKFKLSTANFFQEKNIYAENIKINQIYGKIAVSELSAKFSTANNSEKIYLKNIIISEQNLTAFSTLKDLLGEFSPQIFFEKFMITYIFDKSNSKIIITSISADGDAAITATGEIILDKYYKLQAKIILNNEYILKNKIMLTRLANMRNLDINRPISLIIDSPKPIDINKIYLKNF